MTSGWPNSRTTAAFMVFAMSASPSEGRSEQAESALVVRDEQVLGLLVMVEHRLVVFAPEARRLVSAESGVGGILVIAVGPDPAGLNRAAQPVSSVAVAGPDTSTQAVGGVVGDRDRFLDRLEGRHRQDRTEDLLLEDAHVVLAHEHRRLYEIALVQVTPGQRARTAGQALRALGLADVDIAKDLVELVLGGLGADLGRGGEWIAPAGGGDARDRPPHEPIKDRFVHP